MSQRRFLRQLARHAPRVAISRIKRGPARPSWSFGFELFTSALRDTALGLGHLPWTEQRKAFDGFSNRRNAIVHGSRKAPALVDREFTTLGDSKIPVTSFTPRQPSRSQIDATVLYLHGGGYIFGSAKTHAELISRIALASPARAIAPDYRLAPDYPFPSAIDDCVAVYRALVKGGINPKKLVVSGDSAGGGLTMALLQTLRDAGDPLPAGAALICPWSDLSAEGGSLVTNAVFDWGDEAMGKRWANAYMNGTDKKNPLASPVFANLRGLPPLLIQVGDAELLHDQATMLAARAKEHGVDTRFVVEPDMVHDWHTFAWLFPRCGRAIDEIGAFVRSVTT